MGYPEWLDGERFATDRGRLENRGEVIALLDAEFATRDLNEWVAAFTDEPDVFWALVNSIGNVLAALGYDEAALDALVASGVIGHGSRGGASWPKTANSENDRFGVDHNIVIEATDIVVELSTTGDKHQGCRTVGRPYPVGRQRIFGVLMPFSDSIFDDIPVVYGDADAVVSFEGVEFEERAELISPGDMGSEDSRTIFTRGGSWPVPPNHVYVGHIEGPIRRRADIDDAHVNL